MQFLTSAEPEGWLYVFEGTSNCSGYQTLHFGVRTAAKDGGRGAFAGIGRGRST